MRRAVLLAVLLGLIAPGAAGAATARWERLDTGTPGPGKRSDAAMAATGSRTVWLHGGERDGTPLGDLWRLDLKRERWTRVKPRGAKPAARFGHDVVAQEDGTLVLFGGQSGDRFFGDVWTYDPARNSWTRSAAEGPDPRYGAGVARDPATGTVWVTHGFTDAGRFDDTWGLTGDSFGDSSPTAGERPRPRCLVSAAFAGGRLFLWGGQSDAIPFLDDLWSFDPATRAWTSLDPARRPSARNLYGSAQLGSTWLIHAGATRAGPARDLWSLDLDDPRSFARVRTSGKVPSARFNEGMTPVGSRRAVTYGGAKLDGELADTWVLRLAR